MTPESNLSSHSDDLELEVLLQRIFHEKDPAIHRAALWDLLGGSDDWELFERLQKLGAERSMEGYFRALLENFNEAADASGMDEGGDREQVREMYAAPLLCLHSGDLAGSAGAMHEILLNEIYEIYPISEKDLPFAEATAFGLKPWVAEDVLFPLTIIEFLAFSDYLTQKSTAALFENNLALLLTLFFGAQAYLDMRDGDDLTLSSA